MKMEDRTQSTQSPPPYMPPGFSNALMSLQGHASANGANASASSENNYQPPIPLSANAAVPQLPPSSVINLSNSSDVVIGPMTQYRGPVTIYQYMDATVESRAMNAGGGINQNRTSQSSNIFQRVSNSSKLVILLVFIIILILGGVAYYELSRQRGPVALKQTRDILFGNDYESGTFPNLGNGHLIIEREQWGASKPTDNLTIPLLHPIPYVLITHVGVQSTACFNVYKCSIKMRTLQDSAIAEKYLPDINSNFYVGNDGNIYVGRGWDFANTYANKTLAVTFIGDFIRYNPDEKQFEAVQHLLSYGVAKKYISPDYKLVSQNQTKSTRSPGTNVYKEIVQWPRWYPCGMEDQPICGIEIGLPTVWDGKM